MLKIQKSIKRKDRKDFSQRTQSNKFTEIFSAHFADLRDKN